MLVQHTPSTSPTSALSGVARFHRHRRRLARAQREMADAKSPWPWRDRGREVRRRAAANAVVVSARYLASHSMHTPTRRNALAAMRAALPVASSEHRC